MAHERPRSVLDLYQKLIRASPIVGVFGHRQVGKTTLIRQLTGQYHTLDDRMTLSEANAEPERFLDSVREFPCAIDECQLSPPLFPALKEDVRKNKRPGRWVLSGSVRFTSRRAIRESLTGRMLFFELFPLVLSELDQRPLPDFFVRALGQSGFSKHSFQSIPAKERKRRDSMIERYFTHGGLPGICFFREERLRKEQVTDLHRLILDRDLRMVHETRLSIETLLSFLRMIAGFNWSGHSYAAVQRELGLRPATQKALLYALESIFLVRRIPISGGSRGNVFLLEDQLEEKLLTMSPLEPDFEIQSFLYRNVRAQFHYRMGLSVSVESYWTRNNARVPLLFRSQGHALGVIGIDANEPSLSQIRSAESLLKRDLRSKVLVVSRKAQEAMVFSERLALVPLGWGV